VTAKTDINDGSLNPCHQQLLAQFQVRANLVVPIIQREQLWGLLIAHHCCAPRQWQNLEIDLLKELATHLGIALQQAELYQQAQHELAQHKQTQEQLLIAQERLHHLLNSSPAVIYTCQTWRDYATTFISNNVTSVLGYEKQEFLADARFWANRIHPDDSVRILDVAAQINQDSQTYEYRFLHKDGTYRWVQDRVRLVRNAAGEPLEIVGCILDITASKEAEVALRHSQAALQRQLAEIEIIYQSAPIGLAVLDTNLRFVRINQRLAEINGYPVEQHIGRTVRELLPDLADTAEQTLLPILATGEAHLNVEIRGQTPAQPGVERIWLEHFLPLKDNNHVLGISIVCEEITERKLIEEERRQAEEALRESEERFRNMADNAPVMIWVTDSTGYCIYLSKTWYDFTGQTEATGLGDGWLDAIHPQEREYTRQSFLMANERGETLRLEYRLRRFDGEYRWIIDAATPRFGRDGKFEGYIGSVIDITERKQAEAQREEMLQREQAAREAAEAANRIKDEFLAVLSHELRTPLNPILGWSNLLQNNQVSPEKLQQGLATIERNAKQQAQLIDDLLDISRIIRGKLSLNFIPVNLATPIRSALETVRLAMEAKSIQLQVILGPNVGQVMGDIGRLQQVIWNLLSNATKFTPAGGLVTVRLTQVDSHAQIQVSDTGKGIQREFLPHVFELFRQQDSSTTRRFGGLGLGLAIARQIVEAHGGTISADSLGEGKGATFIVCLPLARAAASDTPAVVEKPTSDLANIRVLVVEDELDSLTLMNVLLEAEGAIVTAVSSGEDALSAITQSQFDILISDIAMPGMDGYALIGLVRSLPPEYNRDIPALALTAYAGESEQRRAIAAGFQSHLPKPIEPDSVISTVAALVTLDR
jgi:PAS domain S-box-containing protein